MPAKPGPLRPHEERRNYARPEPAMPLPGNPALGDSFLIVTEGAVTERLYFESVRGILQLAPVTARVVHPECTDALGLVRAAMVEPEGLSHRDSISFDHVWVLFDTDVPARQGQLEPALELARNENIRVGYSTPSVEIWLLLHFRDRPGALLNSEAAERAVSEAWGQRYSKSRENFAKLWPALQPNIPAAVSRANQARDYHQQAGTPIPPNPSTQLDLLVRALNATVQAKMRLPI